MRIKVLHVLMDNNLGGPQLQVLSVSKLLKQKGIEIEILTPKGGGSFYQKAKEEGFDAHQIRLYGPKHFNSLMGLFSNIRWALYFFISVFQIVLIIKKRDINIVHVYGLFNLQAALAAKLTGKKLVWSLISSLYPRFVVAGLMPIITNISDIIVFLGERLKNYYLENQTASKAAIYIIHNPVDINRFSSMIAFDNTNYKKKEFDIDPETKVVACVGNINPAKGFEYFVKSAFLIRNKMSDVKFLIVGASIQTQQRYFQYINKLITSLELSNDVIITGWRDDIPQLINTADILVLSSIAEGSPLVVLEAMAAGKPVVATDVGSVNDQIIHNVNGFIVQTKNPEAIASKVLVLLENPHLRNEMGKQGKERANELFSLEKCALNYENLYRQL